MSRKTARPSRLSMQTQLKQLEQENLDLREGLETIADVLEELGILEVGDDEEEPLYGDPPVIKGESEVVPELGVGEDDPSNLIEPETEK